MLSATAIQTGIAATVGRIVVFHGLLEAKLGRLVQLLAGIDPKVGRIVLRKARGKELIGMMEDVAFALKLDLKTDLTKLQETINRLKGERDLIAHGVWIKRGKQLYIQVTSGLHPLEGTPHNTDAKIDPTKKAVTQEWLSALLRDIKGASRAADRLEPVFRKALAEAGR
jgi:hypothetical protein